VCISLGEKHGIAPGTATEVKRNSSAGWQNTGEQAADPIVLAKLAEAVIIRGELIE